MRVVCLSMYVLPAASGVSAIQQTVASIPRTIAGWFVGRQIMSPRETSRSSSRRIVTDIGGKAASIGPS